MSKNFFRIGLWFVLLVYDMFPNHKKNIIELDGIQKLDRTISEEQD